METEQIINNMILSGSNFKAKHCYDTQKDAHLVQINWQIHASEANEPHEISAKLARDLMNTLTFRDSNKEIASRLIEKIKELESLTTKIQEMEKYCISREAVIRDLKNENANLNISLGNATHRADFHQDMIEKHLAKNIHSPLVIPNPCEKYPLMDSFTALIILTIVAFTSLAVLFATGAI